MEGTVIRTRREGSSLNDDPCRMNSETNQSTKKMRGRGQEGRRECGDTDLYLVLLGPRVIMTKLLSSKCSEFLHTIDMRTLP